MIEALSLAGDGKQVFPSMKNERIFMGIAADVETIIRKAVRSLSVEEDGRRRSLTSSEKEPFYVAALGFAKAALDMKQHVATSSPRQPAARKLLLAANDQAYAAQTESARFGVDQAFAEYPAVGKLLLDEIDAIARQMHQLTGATGRA